MYLSQNNYLFALWNLPEVGIRNVVNPLETYLGDFFQEFLFNISHFQILSSIFYVLLSPFQLFPLLKHSLLTELLVDIKEDNSLKTFSAFSLVLNKEPSFSII